MKVIFGHLIVHCRGNMSSYCDFKKEDEKDKAQCKYNNEMECGNGIVLDCLLQEYNKINFDSFTKQEDDSL